MDKQNRNRATGVQPHPRQLGIQIIAIDDNCDTEETIRNDEFAYRKRISSSFISNPQLLDSMSSLDIEMQRRIINVITVFSVLFFTVCFVMIAFTLRYSEYVDETSRLLMFECQLGVRGGILIASIKVRNRYRIDELTTVDGNRKVLRPIFIKPKVHEKTRKILRILKNETLI